MHCSFGVVGERVRRKVVDRCRALLPPNIASRHSAFAPGFACSGRGVCDRMRSMHRFRRGKRVSTHLCHMRSSDSLALSLSLSQAYITILCVHCHLRRLYRRGRYARRGRRGGAVRSERLTRQEKCVDRHGLFTREIEVRLPYHKTSQRLSAVVAPRWRRLPRSRIQRRGLHWTSRCLPGHRARRQW